MCLPNLKNLTFPLTNFSPNYPPINIPFLFEKLQICPNWVLFTMIASKYTQFFFFFFFDLGSFISDRNPPIAIPNFAKKHSKRQAHIPIPCQCENPPVSFSHSWSMGVHDRGRVDQRVQNAFQMETKRQKIVKRRSKWKGWEQNEKRV